MKKTLTAFVILSSLLNFPTITDASGISDPLDSFHARPPVHTFMDNFSSPQGLSPDQVKSAYGLPATGGSGTIAIISAFHHTNIESDLAVFDKAFSLANCTVKNKCLEINSLSASAKTDNGWDAETALDTEWAHAIAPKAKILVVEAANDSGTSLLKAVDYAASRTDVVAVSMSWGGDEFSSETKQDSHFIGKNSKIAFFASSGDDGAGASWPASSPNVIAVGGTSLVLSSTKSKTGKVTVKVNSESAWSGSGGGVSAYEKEPAYQTDYSIPKAGGMRAVPDVSYAADPTYGFSVYHSTNSTAMSPSIGSKGWSIVGGTSAGAPQWAAIHALGKSVSLAKLYADKSASNNSSYFRDIVGGKNGDCPYFCIARKRYDYVTGLGSPVTWKF